MLLTEIIKFIKNGKSGFIKSHFVEDINIISPASISCASQNQITFLEENNDLKENIYTTKASAIILFNDKDLLQITSKRNISIIVVSHPKIAFAEILNIFKKEITPLSGIDSSANINSNSNIGDNCYIGPNVFVGKNTSIGKNNFIYPGTVILDNVEIGDNNIIHPNCVIYQNTKIKDYCIINSNTVLGSEGFGFIPKDGKWLKVPQTGGVVINNSVEIGTNCCIDRPAVGDTIIGEGTKIDNLVQIGHGVKIGRDCAFAAQVGIAGGAIIGDGVILAGQVGVNNRVKVGNKVIASSKCGIHADVRDGEVISGFPAIPNKLWLRSSTLFKKLPELAKKLRQLDKK